MTEQSKCEIKGCEKPSHCHDWCRAHYNRWLRYGDPIAGKTAVGMPDKFLREVVFNYNKDKCLSWPFNTATGYALIARQGKPITVSRIICEHFYGPRPTSKHQAAHSCKKNKSCVNPKHLRWATPAENSADRLIHGTHQFGKRNSRVKLTKQDVRKIRKLESKLFQREIAKKFGVGISTIGFILNRKTWAWLE